MVKMLEKPKNTNAGDGDKKTVPGNDPTPPAKESQEFDPSTIGDEDLNKVFDDPRIWKHPRFKQLNERAKKAKEFEEAEATRQETSLKEQKKFEELATKTAEERDSWKGKFNESIINNAIMKEASKQGIQRLDLALKLIDKKEIEVGDEGQVQGLEDRVKTLITDNEFLVDSNSNKSLGSDTNPRKVKTGAGEFTITQIQDPTFYQANLEAINKAQVHGRIVDDRPQR